MRFFSITRSTILLLAVNAWAVDEPQEPGSLCLESFGETGETTSLYGVAPMTNQLITGTITSGEYLEDERILLFTGGELSLYQWSTGESKKLSLGLYGADECIDTEMGLNEQLALPSAKIGGRGITLGKNTSCFISDMKTPDGGHMLVLCTHKGKKQINPFYSYSGRQDVCKQMQAYAQEKETLGFDYSTCLSNLETGVKINRSLFSSPNHKTNTTVIHNTE